MQVNASADARISAPAASGNPPPQPRLSATQAGDVSAGRARVVEGQVYQIGDRSAPAVESWGDQPRTSAYRQSYDQVAARLGTSDRATVTAEISRQLYGEAAPQPSPTPSPSPSPTPSPAPQGGGSQEGVGSFLEGAVLGNFSENNSWSATAGQVVTGFIPVVGQIADARDTIASIGEVIQGKEGGWLDLGASVVGWVPGVGDAAKAAIRAGEKVAEAGVKTTEKLAVKEAPKAAEQASKGADDAAKTGKAEQQGAKAAEETTRKQIVMDGGQKGEWPKELNAKKLEPNADYLVNGYHYATDAQGRVTEASGKLELKTADRNSYQQSHAGGEDRLPTDQGGHLIATIFHGPGDRLNLVPMNGNLNTGVWKRMENSFADALKQGKEVDVDIKVVYSADSTRPTHFTVDATIDGEPKTFVFRNKAGG